MLTGKWHVQIETRGSELHTNVSMSTCTHTHTHWKPLKNSTAMSFRFRQNVCKIPAAHLYAFSVLEDKNFALRKIILTVPTTLSSLNMVLLESWGGGRQRKRGRDGGQGERTETEEREREWEEREGEWEREAAHREGEGRAEKRGKKHTHTEQVLETKR